MLKVLYHVRTMTLVIYHIQNEAHAMSDHIHMLLKIPPKMSVSSFMGYLKGKSSLMIFDEHANLKYNYRMILTKKSQ